MRGSAIQFISLAPDGKTLAVLDAGARSVRTIEIDSRAVSTLVDWDAVRRAVPSSSGTFARVIAIPGGVVLLDQASAMLVRVTGGEARKASESGAPTHVSDLAFHDGT